MSNAINLVTGAYSATEALAFVPLDAVDADTLEAAQHESDEGNEVSLMEIGAKFGFVLDPFAPLIFTSVDHPSLGTINDVFSSEADALSALEGLLEADEEVDPEVGIIQHLIDVHRCVVSVEQFSDPRLKRVHQVEGWSQFDYLFETEAAPRLKQTEGTDALDAVSVALAALEQANLQGLDADIADDIRKAVSALNNAEQSLTPQD